MTNPEQHPFLSDGGVCGALARSIDWAKTPLGPVDSWSASLKATVGTVLHSRHPMFLWWGPELIQIYNDAYLPSFGEGKHPNAMGQRGVDCWQEIWPIIWPQIDDVMQRGVASWNEDRLVPIFRNGAIEEVCWTYGYSPVHDDDGVIGGTLVVCTETTRRVLAERRLESLRQLAVALATTEDAVTVERLAAECLGKATYDVPFAIMRVRGEELVVGLDLDEAKALVASSIPRPSGARQVLERPLAIGPWPEPVAATFVVPLERGSTEAIVFGLSPRLPFDDSYRNFLEQIVEHIGNARRRASVETERRNLLEQAPIATALLTGPEHLFVLANPLYREVVGREVVGKTYLEAFPELRGTPLPGILDRVYERGEPFVTEELLVPIDRRKDGSPQDCFFKFNLEPIRDTQGRVYGMMAIAADITEQVNARRELEHASRVKDEFLAMLGHELRNPLAPILTALQLMKLKGPDEITRGREIIERQARHMVSLVDDLLDVSRVAQGKIEVKKARIPLADVVARAVETASPLLEEKAHTLHVDVPTEGLDIDADVVRLSQVVANLLTNAAKYTERGGRIEIVGSRVDDRIALRVIDNGAGIPAESLPRLFDVFFQGPQRSDRSEGGLGLGLALVRSLTALHGGTVMATSAGLGHGSTFELRLPFATLASRSSAPSSSSSVASERPLAATRVMMVDDNTDISELFASFLETFGFEVRTAPDGPSALELAATFRPAVAILDIGLPVMDGYELASRLRERLGAAAPRLIAMTGYGQREDRENSRRAGFERHLVKPVDGYTLVAAITQSPE